MEVGLGASSSLLAVGVLGLLGGFLSRYALDAETLLKTLLLFICQFLGIHLYSFTEFQRIKILRTLVCGSACYVNNGLSSGYVYGKYFIGHIAEADGGHRSSHRYHPEAWLFCHKSLFRKYFLRPDVQTFVTEMKINGSREGELSMITMSLPKTRFTPSQDQQLILSQILECYRLHDCCCTVLITGKVGSGKSTIGRLLADQLGAFLTYNYTPASQHRFGSIYSEIDPSSSSPLVVVVDEIDHIADLVDGKRGGGGGEEEEEEEEGRGKTRRDKNFLSRKFEIYNKATWNGFFDSFDRSAYLYTIFIMTMNKSDKSYSDPSLFRKGRIHLKVEMNKIL